MWNFKVVKAGYRGLLILKHIMQLMNANIFLGLIIVSTFIRTAKIFFFTHKNICLLSFCWGASNLQSFIQSTARGQKNFF